MKKVNNKGFMLLETLLVSAFVITVLVYLYIQFTNLKGSYDKDLKYDTVSNLHNLKQVDIFINKNYGYGDLIKDLSKNNHIELYNENKCNYEYFSDNITYCNKLMEYLNIKTLVIINNDLNEVKQELKSSNHYSTGLTNYTSHIDKELAAKSYLMIAEFNDKTFGTIKVEDVEPKSFATDSWATIAYNSKSDVYNVGDEKTIQMDVNEDGKAETYHIMIVNKTACTTEDSESACGMVLQFKELLNITNNDNKKMNSTATNDGGWPASTMYTYLNTTIYNKLPNDLRSVVINTKVISGHNSTSGEENFISTDKLYLLSNPELFGSGLGDTALSTTRKLDYYPDSTSANNEIRIKYNYGTESANYWWTRSIFTGVDGNYSIINNDGSLSGSSPTVSHGVAPAFRIGK